MKWIWSLWTKRRELSHLNTKLEQCKYHDDRVYPNVLAAEYCKSCDMNVCYICAAPHFIHGCHVECEYQPRLGEGLLGSLNRGCKTLLTWPELGCANCGKDWKSGKEPSICIACLNPTCSAECHLQLQDKQVCTFFKNFVPKVEVYEEVNGFRAIPQRNFGVVDVGQRVTYASPRFMSAVKVDQERILIERGFRQYGNPVEKVLEMMKIQDFNAEYEHRVCCCDCELCQKASHPVYNCLTWCLKSSSYQEKFQECWCICSECIQKGAHAKKDCHYSCKLTKQKHLN